MLLEIQITGARLSSRRLFTAPFSVLLLGIPKNERVAPNYVNIRLNDQFVDDSDRTLYDRASREIDDNLLSTQIISNFNSKARFPEVDQSYVNYTYKMVAKKIDELTGRPEHRLYSRQDLIELGDFIPHSESPELLEEIKKNEVSYDLVFICIYRVLFSE